MALLEAEFFWAEHGGEDSLVELIERAFQQIGDVESNSNHTEDPHEAWFQNEGDD